MSLKKLKILGVILAFFLSFIFHFVYDLFPNFITSIFFPVNESIFEHMKIIFGCILLSGVVQKIIVIKNDLNYNNICISNVIVAFLSIFIFLIMFIPIYSLIGENLPITLIIMLITYIISQILSIYIIKKEDMKKENFAILLVIIIYIIFGIFTYYPLKNNLFIDPIDNTYGIKEIMCKEK